MIERNRRIFNVIFETITQVASRIKEDIEQRKRAITWEVYICREGGGRFLCTAPLLLGALYFLTCTYTFFLS
jgi:hypothetical protein